jgi:hypothetical protein
MTINFANTFAEGLEKSQPFQRPQGLEQVDDASASRSNDLASEPCEAGQAERSVQLTDFHAVMTEHKYLFKPTGELWPAASVNGRINPWPKARTAAKKPVAPASWLDQHRAVEQLTWHPAEPTLIHDRVVHSGGWAPHDGATVFNLYRGPVRLAGEAKKAGLWRDHLRRIYPTEAEHIERWLAHRLQRPGEKLNHALVLGGGQGIGKDTVLEPVKAGVGAWNWQDVSPAQMSGRFNGFAKSVVVRVNEARDLGEGDKYGFYDLSKVYIAAPPDVIRVDEKNLREHYVPNVCGVIITTNHKTDGLYLPADDRRHFVAWSDATRDDFSIDYWTGLYGWYQGGGTGHVNAYLRALDLSSFDPKAPPPKTAAFWSIVQTGEAPESGELRDVLDQLCDPDALTLAMLLSAANQLKLHDLYAEISDRKNRRSLPHKLERVGYVPVRNPDADDGLFKIEGKRQAVYANKRVELSMQIRAARQVSSVGAVSGSTSAISTSYVHPKRSIHRSGRPHTRDGQ